MFNWILGIIDAGGYAGIFFLMVLENVFPPIPSEIILPLAGYMSATGELNVYGVVFFAIVGSLVGSLIWYLIGRWFSLARLKFLAERYGRWLTITPAELDYASTWFNKNGYLAVLFGRLLPLIRALISIPAGLTKMPFSIFLIYSTVGITIWNILLVSSGYLLEAHYTKVASFLDPLANLVLVLIVGIYLYRVITFNRRGKD